MANVYVWSGAVGTGTGADWTNAYTTLAAALTAKAAGDSFWVADDHAQTQASAMTMTLPGTAASPNRVICVNRAGSVPPVSADLRTTATISTTGANNLIVASGHAYFYGIKFQAGSAANTAVLWLLNNAGAGALMLDSCGLTLNNTSSASIIQIGETGNSSQFVELVNPTLTFGATGQSLEPQGPRFIWRGGSFGGATLPTTLFTGKGGIARAQAPFLIEAVDLSAMASGKTLVGSTITAASAFLFKDCKMGASVTVAATPPGLGAAKVHLVRCDSGDTNYRNELYASSGTLTTETTIVRTGGASDGTTPISWKILTTANSKRYMPFEALPIAIWNETTGSAITLTLEGIWGGGAVPTNADIWMDVEYLGTSGFPLGAFATSGPADQLAAGTNLTSSSETWGGSTTKFKMSVTFTPQEKGTIYVYVKAATASSTFYIDPKPVLS